MHYVISGSIKHARTCLMKHSKYLTYRTLKRVNASGHVNLFAAMLSNSTRGWEMLKRECKFLRTKFQLWKHISTVKDGIATLKTITALLTTVINETIGENQADIIAAVFEEMRERECRHCKRFTTLLNLGKM